MKNEGPVEIGWRRMLGSVGDPSCCRYLDTFVSGQISANSNRGRVVSGALALSRQRSFNRSPAFSTGMASHHAGHRLSALASTRWPISMSSQSLGGDWRFASGFAATVLLSFTATAGFADFPVSAVGFAPG